MPRRSLFSLKGKAALVTGGGTGIGAAITRKFLEMGAQVTVCGRRQEKMDALAKSVHRQGSRLHPIVGDIVTQAEDIVNSALKQMDSLDILVNNASISAGRSLPDLEMADWHSVMGTNLDAAFQLCRLCLPHLVQAKGCILHISSVSAVAGEYDDAAYTASKAGLEGLSRHLAVELAGDGVRSNVIRPGLVLTESFDEQPPEFFESQLPLIPLGRLGQPIDIAHAALYLCSEEAAWVTGAVLDVDGGESRI